MFSHPIREQKQYHVTDNKKFANNPNKICSPELFDQLLATNNWICKIHPQKNCSLILGKKKTPDQIGQISGLVWKCQTTLFKNKHPVQQKLMNLHYSQNILQAIHKHASKRNITFIMQVYGGAAEDENECKICWEFRYLQMCFFSLA